MSSIFLLLQKVHENVYDFPMKLNYSEPKIYTGGVDINTWTKLSRATQREALNKEWYVYYSFRNPNSGRLVRQTNIKAGANFFSDKRSRYHILKMIRESLLIVLQEGFNPYEDNTSLVEYLENRLNDKLESKSNNVKQVLNNSVEKQKRYSTRTG